MLDDELYDAYHPELVAMRIKARNLVSQYNASSQDEKARYDILHALFGKLGKKVVIEPPFHCDYGVFIEAGENLFMNFGCVVLDCNRVTIGENVLFGPYVQIYTAYHPVDPQARLGGKEYAAPVRIGNNVWLGGSVIVCAGVTIGDNTTIGAGSVVTKDIPANVFAAGNPCRVIRAC